MNTHEEFLKFNNIDLIFINKDGIDYIALRPILEGLSIEPDSTIRRTKRDRFLGSYTSILSIQVGENGKKQGRNMVCLPEKYIYGWIGHINGHTPELAAYKETCYDLLYNHFKGILGNRKHVLLEKKSVEIRIKHLKNTLKSDDPVQRELIELENKKKLLANTLQKIDNKLIETPELFTSQN